jgi:hypothetical protein
MDRWGERFFDGEYVVEAYEISKDAGLELLHYEIDKSVEKPRSGGKGLEATREHLNNGTLSHLFETYLGEGRGCFYRGRKELRLVLTGKLYPQL